MRADVCIKSNTIFDGKSVIEGGGAVLIKGDRIMDVVPIGEEVSFIDHHTKIYEYEDKLVMPGLMDAHTHFFSAAISASEHVISDLGDSKSEDECARMVYEFAKDHPEEKRIRGRGWFVTNWGDAPLPTKASIDRYLPNIPVYLQAADVHSYWLNSAALEECGITRDMTVKSGYIGKLDDGELSGLLVEEEACRPAKAMYEEFTDEERISIYKDYMKLVASFGVTSMSEMLPSGYDEKQFHEYMLLKEMSLANELSVRIHLYSALYDTESFDVAMKWKKEIDDDYVKLSGTKGFIDGVAETYTGLLLEPYSDKPDTCGIGVPIKTKEELTEQVVKANRAGLPVRIHCIADGSVRMALDAFETAVKSTGVKLPNAIEHIENIHPDDIGRFNVLGVVPSMQPIHIILDADGKINRIGKERIRFEWPTKTMLDAAGLIAIGTDAPVVEINPFRNIYASITRCFFDGRKASHNNSEKLSMLETLKGYTHDSAVVYSRDDELGVLKKGYLADIAVMDRNLFDCEPQEVLKARVCLTIVGGKVVYEDN